MQFCADCNLDYSSKAERIKVEEKANYTCSICNKKMIIGIKHEGSIICDDCDSDITFKRNSAKFVPEDRAVERRSSFGMDEIRDADEVIGAKPRHFEVARTSAKKEYAIGFATYCDRSSGKNPTYLVMAQMYVKGDPILIMRHATDLVFMRFKEVPTAEFKEVREDGPDNFYLLGNGQLVSGQGGDVYKNFDVVSLASVSNIAKKNLDRFRDPRFWFPGEFRGKQMMVLTVSITIDGAKVHETESDPARLLT